MQKAAPINRLIAVINDAISAGLAIFSCLYTISIQKQNELHDDLLFICLFRKYGQPLTKADILRRMSLDADTIKTADYSGRPLHTA